MMACLLDGKETAKKIRARIALETAALKEKTGVVPGLAVVLVGEDPASEIYVRNKKKACAEAGFHSEEYRLPADAGEEALLDLIARLNEAEEVDGILVQLPLPAGYDEKKVIAAIAP